MDTTQNHIIAIDVSKESLQVQTPEQSFPLSNDKPGILKLIKRLKPHKNAFVVFESTGGYESLLMDLLHQAKISLCQVNATKIHAFARSEGIQAKTDPIDARTIWRFAKEKDLSPTPAPSQHQRRLVQLMDRRSQLKDILAKEKTRRHRCPESVLKMLDELIRVVEAQIQELEQQIRRLVHSQKTMHQQLKTFTSVAGVGEVTAWSLMAYLPEIRSVKRATLVALAGLAPFNHDSGKTSKRRRIQGGRAKVRKALYMAVQTACKYNPVIQPYVERLKNKGKPHKCACVAAMRKLLIHLQSLLKKHPLLLDS